MSRKFIEDFKHTVKQDIRLFFAPYRGAWQGIKNEFPHFEATSFTAMLKSILRLLIAPFMGAFKAVKQEMRIK